MLNTLGDVITWGLIIAALIVVPYKIAKAWLWPIVKDFFVSAPDVMSRSEEDDRPAAPLLLQTDDRQTPRPAQWPKLTPDETLDICKVLRRRGFLRDEARLIFRAFHQPLDNNLWAAAAPDEDTHLTPIAGRPTKAQFEQDPDMAYEAPPR